MTQDELRSIAQKHRAYYTVETELAVRDGARYRTAFLIRLWGIHEKGAGALPGCPKSREIARHLTAIAAFASAELPSGSAEISALPMALYDSHVVPGADEVSVGVRIPTRTPEGPATEDRLANLVRRRLREVGLSQR